MAAKNLKEAVKEDLKENEEKIVHLTEDDVEEIHDEEDFDVIDDEKENIFKRGYNWSKKHWKGLTAGAAGLALVIGAIVLGKTSDEDFDNDEEERIKPLSDILESIKEVNENDERLGESTIVEDSEE